MRIPTPTKMRDPLPPALCEFWAEKVVLGFRKFAFDFLGVEGDV